MCATALKTPEVVRSYYKHFVLLKKKKQQKPFCISFSFNDRSQPASVNLYVGMNVLIIISKNKTYSIQVFDVRSKKREKKLKKKFKIRQNVQHYHIN